MYCNSGLGRQFGNNRLNDVLNESILNSVVRIENFATYKNMVPKGITSKQLRNT
jgi:hypothetical protein